MGSPVSAPPKLVLSGAVVRKCEWVVERQLQPISDCFLPNTPPHSSFAQTVKM